MKYIKYIGIFIMVLVGIYAYYLHNKNILLQEQLSISKENIKAYIYENDSIKDYNRMFKLTTEELKYSNDSLINRLDKVRKELKIKDKELKQLQYIKSTANKIDTIIYTDTIFKDSTLDRDTIIEDNWYKLFLKLKYPNTIIANPSFISEKYVIINYRKETINPPKKCFILRWFQKKHTILEVNVVEKNPYIENKNSKFIEVIK